MKVVRLSARRTDRLYYRGDTPGVAGKIKSMKKPNDRIGNRTRDLPACSAVPQPTAPPMYREIIYVYCKTIRNTYTYTVGRIITPKIKPGCTEAL